MNLGGLYLIIYNAFVWSYIFAIRLTQRWNPKARKWIKGRKDLFERLAKTENDQRPTLWMHCASLGEFEQGRPLLENFRLNHPGYRIVLTFFSPSGYEVRKDYPGADAIYYLPLGHRGTAEKFIKLINPKVVFWIKYEYWYHYLQVLHQNKIPVFLVSATFRADQPFFRFYGLLHRQMLGFFTHIFVQNEESIDLLQSIGFLSHVSGTGDTRFDRVIEIAEGARSLPLIDQFCQNHPVVVAGSTWLEDEEELDHFANHHPGIRFIIAPHETDEDRVQEIEKLFASTIRYSRFEKTYSSGEPGEVPPVNTLIIDNVGMLAALYKYARIAYVGGGFGREGIHNILEAAVYGKPVVFGPEYKKFNEARDLIEVGGAFSVTNALELEKLLSTLLSDQELYQQSSKAAREFVYANRGASGRILKVIRDAYGIS